MELLTQIPENIAYAESETSHQGLLLKYTIQVNTQYKHSFKFIVA